MRGLIAATIVLAACVATPAPTPPPSGPSGAASPIVTSTPAPSPSAALAPGTYVGSTYRLTLPSSWRRASCMTLALQSAVPGVQPQAPISLDTFVPVREEDEESFDVGFGADAMVVRAERNAALDTPRGYAERGSLGLARDLTIEDTTLDGRPAVLVRNKAVVAGRTAGIYDTAYVVADRSVLYIVAYRRQDATTDQVAAERALATFHVLPDGERPSPTPSPPPAPRLAQAVAAGLADAFARRDASAVSSFMAPCMSSGAEQAGGSLRPRSGYVAQLRSSFAAGLTVAVEPTVSTDQFGTFVPATWTVPGQPAVRRDLYLRNDDGRWTWWLDLRRQSFP